MFAGPLGRSTFTPPKSSFDSPLYGLVSLRRSQFYGNRGRINARDLWEQMNSCSCLTLIVACIIYWQARDMSRVIRTADPERHGIELSLLRHVSPIEWDNIVLYGEYVLNRRLVRRTRSRP